MERKDIKKYLEIIEAVRNERKAEEQESTMQKFWDLGDLIDEPTKGNPKETMVLYIELESKIMSLLEDMKEEYFKYGLSISKIVDLD